MLVVLQPVLVANHLSVQFVNQFVHCGIQIFAGAFGKQIAAFDMDVAFSALSALLFLLIFNR